MVKACVSSDLVHAAFHHVYLESRVGPRIRIEIFITRIHRGVPMREDEAVVNVVEGVVHAPLLKIL